MASFFRGSLGLGPVPCGWSGGPGVTRQSRFEGIVKGGRRGKEGEAVLARPGSASRGGARLCVATQSRQRYRGAALKVGLVSQVEVCGARPGAVRRGKFEAVWEGHVGRVTAGIVMARQSR